MSLHVTNCCFRAQTGRQKLIHNWKSVYLGAVNKQCHGQEEVFMKSMLFTGQQACQTLSLKNPNTDFVFNLNVQATLATQ